MTRAVFLAATLLAVTVYAQTRDMPVAMGNLGVHYNSFKTVISTDEHPLTASLSGPIWCQATLNEVPLPIVKSNFVRYTDPKRRRFEPDVNHTTQKASLEVGETVIDNMGKYRCEIQIMENDENERTVFGNLMVYSSPFFHTNGSMNMVAEELNKHEVKADQLYTTEGARMEIHCPAVGYPKPTIHWYKNSELLAPSDRVFLSNNGTLLTIDKFSSEDEAEYMCTATNEYPTRLDVDWKKHEASLKQKVSIGSPYGWIYPLLVILVILLLLFIIIYACAACKRFQHDNYNVAKREKLLRTPSPASSAASNEKYELVSSA